MYIIAYISNWRKKRYTVHSITEYPVLEWTQEDLWVEILAQHSTIQTSNTMSESTVQMFLKLQQVRCHANFPEESFPVFSHPVFCSNIQSSKSSFLIKLDCKLLFDSTQRWLVYFKPEISLVVSTEDVKVYCTSFFIICSKSLMLVSFFFFFLITPL